MCGIIGYTGVRETAPILLEGLSRLEYRGYDSAGVALQNGQGVEVRKVAGRVEALVELLRAQPVRGTSGIGHTRWATHGAPNTRNAHPHLDCTGTIALVHNGIIENAAPLRAHLESAGHALATPTDSELLAHLIEEAAGATLEDKVLAALSLVTGTYGLAVISAAEPTKIVVARKGSPVLLGIGSEGELFVASDPSAVLGHTRTVVYLEDGDVAVLTPEGYRILDLDGGHQARDCRDIDWDLAAIDLGGYPHFMLKEIFEQPESITNTLRGRLLPEEGNTRLDGLNLKPGDAARFREIVILGCGTSWHAGLVGRHLLETLARIPTRVEYASEFRYDRRLPLDDVLIVAISQSGETADTLEALRAAREDGGQVVGIVNVVGSTIARAAEGGIYLHAGPEIGVASTKAFTSQLAALALLGIHLGRARGTLGEEDGRTLVRELQRIPESVDRALELNAPIRQLASRYMHAPGFLYLGRSVSFPVALEGALKLKEVSYIHAEGYPAAEMKHGPIALIDARTPVVFVAPRDAVYSKVISSMEEVRARGGRIVAVTTEGSDDLAGAADHQLRVPETHPLLSPLVTVVPLQLLAYHVAVLRGCDVDRPRNLAKSVTVE